MTYPRPFLRLVAIGTLYDVEDFSFSMSLIQGPNGPSEPPDQVPAAIVSAFTAFWAAPSLFSNKVALQTLKLNQIGTDGRYTEPTSVQHDFSPNIFGGAGTYLPPQIAYAVSLQTAVARGRAHAGRFYLPTPGVNVTAAGYIQPSDLLKISAPVETLLQAINAAFNDEWVLGVTSNIGAGVEHVVTRARYGRVYDTIRNRREKFDEAYTLGNPL
jgi:hypothetical protein